MAHDCGVDPTVVFGAFTAALLVSAFASPLMGRTIDRLGGRPVMATGSLCATAALLLLALAHGPVQLVAGWLLAGAAMAMTLYDPAFASLHRLRPGTYRRAVTALTLWGGFASTVFWPIANGLQDAVGWRWTLAAFAAVHLFACLPIHLRVLPREERREPAARDGAGPMRAPAALFWLAASFTTVGLIVGALGVRLIDMLQAGGLTAREAVWIGALIGPMQVLGRVLEFTVARHARAVHVGFASFGLMTIATLVLLAFDHSLPVAIAAVVLYGMANGLNTIVQGIAPAEIIGGPGIGTLLGRIARPALVARATAPFVASLVLAAPHGSVALRMAFVVLAVAAGLAFAMAARLAPPPR